MSASLLKGVVDYLTPVLVSSAFVSSGVLTPEEFTSSGSQLVHSCRTWKWEGGRPGTAKAYLQPDKQFLITRNVPCPCRANAYAMQVSSSRSRTQPPLPAVLLTAQRPPTFPAPRLLTVTSALL